MYNKISLSLVFVTLFFYVLSPKIQFYLPLNTGLIVSVIVFCLCFRKILSLNVFVSFLVILLVCGGLYSEYMASVHSYSKSGLLGLMFKSATYIVFGYISVSLFTVSCGMKKDKIYFLIKVFMLIIFSNAVLILLEFIFNPFRDFIEINILVDDVDLGNINYKAHPWQLRGLAAGGGSSLSIAHSLAILFAVYLYYKNKIQLLSSSLYMISLSVTCIFLGRTGIIISMFLILVYIFLVLHRVLFTNNKSKYIIIAPLGLILIVSIKYLFDYINDEYSIILQWAFSFDNKVGAMESVNKLFNSTQIIDDYSALLFGLGYYFQYHPIVSPSDSGYFKLIYSVGFPFALLIYLYISLGFTYLMNKLKLFPLSILIVSILLVCEIKEPIFFQNYTARIFFYLFGAVSYYTQFNNKPVTYKKVQIQCR
jgi:hypothetical protein